MVLLTFIIFILPGLSFPYGVNSVFSFVIWQYLCLTAIYHITQSVIVTYQLHNRFQYRQLEAHVLDHTAVQQVTGFQALRLNP